jgi:MFS transporter, ENTS family, enterobactin (siderophore) exporter
VSPSLLRDREFRTVLLGQGLSAIGDGVTFTALPLLVLQLTGSGLQMGIVGALQMLPDLVLGLPAGVLADRWDRRRMMLIADLGRALLVALIPLSLVLGLPTMAVILLVTVPINALRVLFMAGYTAAVPNLVGRERLGQATSYFESAFALGWILGPVLAGLLAVAFGPGPTLAIDALSFLASAASLLFVRRSLRATGRTEPRGLLSEIREGIAFVARHPTLRAVVVHWSLYTIAIAPVVAVITYYVTVDRGFSADALGLGISAFGAGSLVGSLAAARFMDRPLGLLMAMGTAVSGSMFVFIGFADSLALMVGLSFLAGLGEAIVLVSYVALRAGLTPDALLGRVGATTRTLSLGLQPVGMLIGGALLESLGGTGTLLVIGGWAVAMSVAAAFWPSLRRAQLPVRAGGPRRDEPGHPDLGSTVPHAEVRRESEAPTPT